MAFRWRPDDDPLLVVLGSLLGHQLSFDIKTKLKLFDSLVSPILLYAAKVWGIYEYEHIDKIHIKFCKNILGVRTQTPNYAVYGDLGRYPLCVIAKERSIKYWLNFLSNNTSLMFKLFQTQIDNLTYTHSQVGSSINVRGLRVSSKVYLISLDLVSCGLTNMLRFHAMR